MFNDIAEAQTLSEIVKRANQRLDAGAWDYLAGGSETETTLRRNRQALDSLGFRPRVLRDVGAIDTATTFLGAPQRIPVMLAPVGSLDTFDAGGALAQARAAETFGVSSIISSVSPPGLAGVRAECQAHMVYQVYVRGGEDWLIACLEEATAAGFSAFCLTVDTAIYGRRERDLIKRYMPMGRRRATGQNFQANLSWKHVELLRRKSTIPIVLKGIATAEDARLAVDHGVDVVYVSNHGGRQLDCGRGAIDVLPEIHDEVAGGATIVVDGGFMRASDVLKAIALGADMVAIGKLYAMGLAAGGEAGAVRVLELLETEMTTAMGLLGVARLADLTPAFVQPVDPVREASVASAHPLIGLRDRVY